MSEAASPASAGMSSPQGFAQGVYLGFDFGQKRIGAAIGESLTRQARPLPAISNSRQPDWEKLGKLLAEWRPVACVVGLPVDLDGKEQAVTVLARGFARELHKRYGLPVHLVDERLTSRAADAELRSARSDGRMARRVKSGDRDGVAARLILEQWLNEQPSEPVSAPLAATAPGAA